MAFEFSRRAGRLTRRWAELRKTSCVSRRKPFKSIFMMHPDKIECLFFQPCHLHKISQKSPIHELESTMSNRRPLDPSSRPGCLRRPIHRCVEPSLQRK